VNECVKEPVRSRKRH